MTRTFGHIIMRKKRRLDLRAGDVVTGGNDHVVAARGKVEEAVGPG
jgi:hypothetical protein